MKPSVWSSPIESIKCRVYLVVLPVAVLVCAMLYSLESRNGSLHVVDQLGLPLFGGLCSLLFVGLRFWPRYLKMYEMMLYSGFATFYLASLTYSVATFAFDISGVWNLAGLTYWSPVLYTLAFLVFGVRQGLWAGVGIQAIFGLTVMNYFLLRTDALPGDGTGAMLLQGFFSGTVTLFLLWAVGGVVAAQTRDHERLRTDAHTDPLTHIGNRRSLERQLQREAESAGRIGTNFCVAFLDIDHFKRVNDEYGHAAGDRVLGELSRLLKRETRTLDTIGRWGGEEFLLVLPGLPLDEAQEAVERLRLVVTRHAFPDVGRITLSAGVAAFRHNETLVNLLGRVDQALYQAKEAGRNQVVVDASRPSVQDGELLN